MATVCIWDVLGETLWVVLYVMLGHIFSDRVQYLAELLGIIWSRIDHLLLELIFRFDWNCYQCV